jgi:hypothetical protein
MNGHWDVAKGETSQASRGSTWHRVNLAATAATLRISPGSEHEDGSSVEAVLKLSSAMSNEP